MAAPLRPASTVFFAIFSAVLLLPCRAEPAVPAIPAALPDQAARLEAIVKAFLQGPELKNSTVGVEILDLPSGDTIFDFNGKRRFVPASVLKILTAACALDTFTERFRFKTSLGCTAAVKGDRLLGDLSLETSQDPTLSLADLSALFASLRNQGIKNVEGSLLLAPVPGATEHFSPGWLVEDWGQDWAPVSSNLVIDRNLAPAGDPGRGLKTTARPPPPPPAAILSTLLSSGISAGWVYFDVRDHAVNVYRSPLPALSSGASLIVANPDAYNLELARALARAAGIRFASRVIPPGPDQQAKVLVEHHSQPLGKIIALMLKDSDNLYAQQLLRALGLKYRARGTGIEATLEERGLDFLRDWLVKIGVPPQEVVILDGCGLSRKSCLTPHALNLVLKHMAGSNLDGRFLDLLRVSGQPGGASFRFKTGAMDSVRAVAGVIRTTGGSTLAVSIMVNGHTRSVRDARVAINRLIEQIRLLPPSAARTSATAVPRKRPEKPVSPAAPKQKRVRPKARRHR